MLDIDAMEVLELLPVWRVREQPEAAKCLLWVLTAQTAEKQTGFIVLHQQPQGDAARLLENILYGFGLVGNTRAIQSMATRQIGAQEVETFETLAPAWLWVDDVARREIRQESYAQLIRLVNEKILLSPALESLLHDGAAKAALWAAWCGMRF